MAGVIKRNFQSRLSRFHDRIVRKLNDNNISLSAEIVDVIRIRLKLSKTGDIESRVIEDIDVVPVILPFFKEVPLRRMKKNDQDIFTLETLPNNFESHPFDVISVRENMLYIGDLIVKTYMEPDIPFPLVLVLQITEVLGTFGLKSLISVKYKAIYYNETLPSEALETITAIAQRRLNLNY